MAAPKRQILTVTQVVGMNTTDPEISLPPGQVRMVENVDLLVGGLGEKRRGFVPGPEDVVSPTVNANTNVIASFRHVPNGDDGDAEFWAVTQDNLAQVELYRYASATWTLIATPDTPTFNEPWSFATFNQKLFMAYKSTSGLNRLHVWDGVLVRRVGLAPPAAAPGLANIGAGALAFTRFYRVRFGTGVGSPITTLLSEAGPSASITVAASSGVRVTRPAVVDGTENSWFVEAANGANGPWFTIAHVAIGTLTFDDTNATIPTTGPAPEAGLYTLPPSAKYLSVYQNQLLMAGAWETTSIAGQTVPKNNRVWYTRPLGSLEISDDESITTTLTLKFYVDTGEDNGRINGLSYPVNGIPYVTKKRQFWSLIPRDSDTAPFAAVRLTDSVGCRDFRTLVIGEDETGDPALYWNSLRGPYRMVRGGMQYIGRDLEENHFVRQSNLAVWASEKRQVWFASASGTQIAPFHVRFGRVSDVGEVRGGWAQYTLALPGFIRTMCEFGDQWTTLSDALYPVIGGQRINATFDSFLWQYEPNTRLDVGSAYRAFIRSGQLTLGELFYNVSVDPPRVYGTPLVNTSAVIQFTLERNLTNGIPAFEAPQVSTVTILGLALPPTTRQIAAFEAIDWSDGEVFRYEIGDAAATLNSWRLFALIVPYERQEEAMSPS